MTSGKFICIACGHGLRTRSGLARHIGLVPYCRKIVHSAEILSEANIQPLAPSPNRRRNIPISDLNRVNIHELSENQRNAADRMDLTPFSAPTHAEIPGTQQSTEVAEESSSADNIDQISPTEDAYRHAGKVYGQGVTLFEMLERAHNQHGLQPWYPWASFQEWEMASWMIQCGASQSELDKMLNLDLTRERLLLSFKNKRAWLKNIDSLPCGPEFHHIISRTVTGDIREENNLFSEEKVDCWARDPVECIQTLLGNPAFKDDIHYAPVRRWTLADRKDRHYGEAWTGDWWWDTQAKLPKGATIAPIILSSDKTNLSSMRGDQTAWPVYLTLGNIAKHLRRQPSKRATMLLAYLPTTKFHCFSNPDTRSQKQRDLFHEALSAILEPLRVAALQGFEMTCGDGNIRNVYPILSAYVADFPEQCLIGCTRQSSCPRCTVIPQDRGDPLNDSTETRDQTTTHQLLKNHAGGRLTTKQLNDQGVRPTYPAFWFNLPYLNIHDGFPPDILHQLHKGVFKDHVVKWCTEIALGGSKEIDRRFKMMPPHSSLRHFSRGISGISQWTGGEYRQMEKVFLGVISGIVSDGAMTATRAVLDFLYLAQYQSHTTRTLSFMEEALSTFHDSKSAFNRKDFNIPKIHSLTHYVESIKSRGTADGYNTESPEWLHIDFAKRAYRASNRREYLIQMTVWLKRQEAVALMDSYLRWRSPDEDTAEDLDETLEEQEQAAQDVPVALLDIVENDNGGESEDDEEDEEKDGEDIGDSDLHMERSVFRLPKKAFFTRVDVQTLKDRFGAHRFLECLTEYLSATVGDGEYSPPQSGDVFSAYKQAVFFIKPAPEAGNDFRDIIKACPSRGSRLPLPLGKHARFDTVLVRKPEGIPRVAQIRAIFAIPTIITPNHPAPVAYVEWFSRFETSGEEYNKMWKVGRNTNPYLREAGIVCLDDIIRSCHLIPKFGREAAGDWTRWNVLERCNEFYLNEFLDLALYADL